MTNSFRQVTSADGEFLWSNVANWTNGVPADGEGVTFDASGSSNPSGYDDIANLSLASLDIVNGFAAVGGSLSLGMVSFGNTAASVFSDTDLGSAGAALTIDGFGTGEGRVGAFGANAVTTVLSATDPGEIYQVDEGGELVLKATPLAAGSSNAGFYYQNSHGTGELPSGTFAFESLGGTVTSLISNIAIGDSLALPGSDVVSVTYGTSSMTIVTNLGTTNFSNVTYSGTTPSGFTVSTDPSGLQRVTFASQQATSFQQETSTAGEFLWSNAANWTNGVPADGGAVTFNVSFASNPGGYDDIASLALDSLAVTSGFAAVGGSLSLGTVSFGNTVASVFSDTDLGSAGATLTIDGFSGSSEGRIGAFGPNALTTVLSATDPGEIYQVDEGGELVLDATPHAAGSSNAGFYYQNSHGTGQLPSGTFAFENPGATVTSLISNAAIGDSVALPGSDIVSVTYGTSSITIVTNLGTTTFSDVTYLGTKPGGFTVSTDPTGLQRVTFTSQQATSFQQVTSTDGEFLWSNAANWTNGVPVDGGAVTFNVSGAGNPSGYDDIASLVLDSLAVTNGFAAVGGGLSLGTVSFGNTVASVFSDTDLGSAGATLTIDGFSGSSEGRIGAFGPNALTTVLSATDPGEIYQVDEGGELVLDATPHAAGSSNAGFYYQNSHGTGELPSGTFAFESLGGTVTSLISNAAIGDSLALTGSDVVSVTYGTNSITIVTNLGTTIFSNVTYSGTRPGGFTVSTDPAGLQRVTFTSPQATSFRQETSTAGEFLWSTAANWTNGVPANGAAVTFNISFSSNPGGYDDIASLALDSLAVTSGFAAVGGSLSLGMVSFGSTVASIFSDTDLGSAGATLTIDGFSGGVVGRVGAFGPNALTTVLSATDPGEIYQVDEGGELVLDATPHAAGSSNAGFYYQNSHGTDELPSGTFAFEDPGGTVASLLSNVAVGDSLALPGTDVVSVTYGTSSMTIVTNLGTTNFSDVTYLANNVLTGFTVATDPVTGLQAVTFTGYENTAFQQVTSTAGEFLWSNAANWTNGVPVDGEGVTFNVSGASNPSGYDDIASLSLANLDVVSGFAAVGGSLSLGSVSFGNTVASVFSDTDLGSAGATLTIDGFGTGEGRIGAFGPNALTDVESATDPGEIYQVDEGGELILQPTPLAAGASNAGFYYQNSHGTGQLPSGTFAFENTGGTIASLISNVAVGDSVALPGSEIVQVSYGTSSMTIVTNLGATTFSDVTYLGTTPNGYTESSDPAGLERVTFATVTATTFQQVAQGIVGGTGEFLWSNAANWTNGVPEAGSDVTFSISTSTPAAPGGYDDIGSLFLDTLNLQRGYIAVGGALTVGLLALGEGRSGGIEADTLLNGGTASVVIDGLTSASHGLIGAEGANAVTTVEAATDRDESYSVDQGGEVVLDPAPVAGSSFTWNDTGAHPSGTFAFESLGATVSNLLAGVAAGDSIALPGDAVESVTFGSNSIVAVTNLGTTAFSDVTYSGSTPTGYTVSTDPAGLERITFIACFLRGTHIMTRRGEMPVEALTGQDEVLTQSGVYRKVRWIGRRRIDSRRHPDPDAVLPIRVSRDAFAVGVPVRDVWLSPDHAVWIEDVLVPIRLLMNGATIARDRSVVRPVYYHVELDRHDILFADGMPAESYLDTGNRTMFENGGATLALHPDFGAVDGQARREAGSCAPLVCDAAGVKPVWDGLARRAEALGFGVPSVETTDDAAPGIVAGGRLYRPLSVAEGRYVFFVPRLRGDGRLVSRAAAPCTIAPWVEDRRLLGVMVRRISFRCGDRLSELSMDDPKLTDGWWAAENDQTAIWRWSNGDACLPIEGDRVMIEVWVGATSRYPVEEPATLWAA
jgi:hypothetical protein